MSKSARKGYAYLKGNPYLNEDRYSMEALHHIKEALVTPTADEVCEALEEETGKRVKYKEDNQAFIEFDSQKYILLPSDVGITVHYRLHAKTLIMIGSFYEGNEE